jgi:hypothetical protein
VLWNALTNCQPLSSFDEPPFSTAEEWASVLVFAHDYGFASVRRLALRSFFPLASSVERIVYGRRCDVPDWILDSFVDLCSRASALKLDEAQHLQITDVVNISALRQEILLGNISRPDVRRDVWRMCCSHLHDKVLAAQESQQQEAEKEPLLKADLAVSNAQRRVDGLKEISNRTLESLDIAMQELENATTTQRQLSNDPHPDGRARDEPTKIRSTAAQENTSDGTLSNQWVSQEMSAQARRQKAVQDETRPKRNTGCGSGVSEQNLEEERAARKKLEQELELVRIGLEAQMVELRSKVGRAGSKAKKAKAGAGLGMACLEGQH